jgi:hypothetical protein
MFVFLEEDDWIFDVGLGQLLKSRFGNVANFVKKQIFYILTGDSAGFVCSNTGFDVPWVLPAI